MKYLGLLFLIHLMVEVYSTSIPSKDSLDPNDPEDNVLVWKNLFIRLNTLATEMEKLNVNVLDLKHRLDTQETMLRTLWNNSRSWTTIQRRQDGSVEFNRSWNEYSNGFGNTNGEYFMGLQRIHDMTTNGPPHELRIILKDFDGHTRYAHYDLFRIGSEAEKYALVELGKYSGDAGDCFTSHRGRKFTTFDQDNDNNPQRNCGAVFQGGWWFFDTCYSGYLNGPYRARNQAHTWGVSWNTFHGWDHSLKYAEMMIRPKI